MSEIREDRCAVDLATGRSGNFDLRLSADFLLYASLLYKLHKPSSSSSSSSSFLARA